MISIRRRRILLIEDDYDSARSLAECLPCYDVYRADTFREATAKLFSQSKKQPYSAMLIDLNLPDGDGAILAKNAHRAWPHMPIIVVTGMSDADINQVSIHRAGVSKVIKKPVDLEELREALLDAIATKEVEQQTAKVRESVAGVQAALTQAIESAPASKR